MEHTFLKGSIYLLSFMTIEVLVYYFDIKNWFNIVRILNQFIYFYFFSISSDFASVTSSPSAFATGSLVSFPYAVLKPLSKAELPFSAERIPLSANSSIYGRVALAKANVDVAGTAPGMFATE